MGDLTSPEIFGKIFSMLAENPDVYNKELAARIFAMTHDYDFCTDEMGVDDELRSLGIEYEKDD